MQNQSAVARIGKLAVLFTMIFGATNIGCGKDGGPSGLSSNPQDWPVPPRCDSRVCEVYARRASECVGKIEGSEMVGTPCGNDDSCTGGVYICDRCSRGDEHGKRYCGSEISQNPWQIICENERVSDIDSRQGRCNGLDNDCDGKIDADSKNCSLTLPCNRIMEIGQTICDCFEQIGFEEIGIASPLLDEDMDMDDCLIRFGTRNVLAHACVEVGQKNTCEDLALCFICNRCFPSGNPLPLKLGIPSQSCAEVEWPAEICPDCSTIF